MHAHSRPKCAGAGGPHEARPPIDVKQLLSSPPALPAPCLPPATPCSPPHHIYPAPRTHPTLRHAPSSLHTQAAQVVAFGEQTHLWVTATAVKGLDQLPAIHILLQLLTAGGLFAPRHPALGTTLPTRLPLVQLLLALQESLVECLQLAAEADTLLSESL